MQQQIIVVIAALLLAGIAATAKADDGLPPEVAQLYEKCLAEVESNPVYTSEESRERAFDDCIDKNGGDE